jgi:hypothetical protein
MVTDDEIERAIEEGKAAENSGRHDLRAFDHSTPMQASIWRVDL